MTTSRGARLRRVAMIAVVVILAAGVLAAVGALAASKPVVGDSMTPTLADGDRIVTDPFSSRPSRFDLVVVRLDGSAESVKRVVGMPGDTFEIVVDDDGEATVRVRPPDGTWRPVDPSFHAGRWGDVPPGCCKPDGTASPAGTGPQIIPPEHYFLLGDNPSASADSRRFGWIARDQIVGVVRWRVWPASALGRPGDGIGFSR